MSQTDREAIVADWCARDRARCVLPADREIVDASTGVRALIVDLAKTGGAEDELYDACAVMGRLIAQRGGSPTLASATLDHACEAMSAASGFDHAPAKPETYRPPSWLVPARAALAEGFAAALIESVRAEDVRSWEFPACAVPLGEAALAITAGHPSDDEEVLAAWAGRIAKGAAARGIRRAVVAGNDRAHAAVVEALTLVGIEVGKSSMPRFG
jgi:hypothetical protein